MRSWGWALAGVAISLAGSAGAQALLSDREAWMIASNVGVEPAGWRLLHRDPRTAAFIRTRPEREGQYRVTVAAASYATITTSLYALSCADRTTQELEADTADWTGKSISVRGPGRRGTPMRTSIVDMALTHACGPQSAQPAPAPVAPAAPAALQTPIVDGFDADGKRLRVAVGRPVTIRVWAHIWTDEAYRMLPSEGVEQVGPVVLYTAPPSSGVGFTQAYDVTLRATREGEFPVSIVSVNHQTGAHSSISASPIRFRLQAVATETSPRAACEPPRYLNAVGDCVSPPPRN
jgi:hypothetical protein